MRNTDYESRDDEYYWGPIGQQKAYRIVAAGPVLAGPLALLRDRILAVEAHVYKARCDRMGRFENVVGRLEMILAGLPKLISGRVLEGKTRLATERHAVISDIQGDADRAEATGFDIDAVTDADLTEASANPSRGCGD